MSQPDPKNVRDALLEAGYGPWEADVMLAAVPVRAALVKLLQRMGVGDHCSGDCRPGIDEHVEDCPEGVARVALNWDFSLPETPPRASPPAETESTRECATCGYAPCMCDQQ